MFGGAGDEDDEDLYNGASKHVKLGRRLLSGGTEDKGLEIQVMPGWKSGTKVRFARAGNELPDGEVQDLCLSWRRKTVEATRISLWPVISQ